MAVIVGADGAIELDLGNGLVRAANIFQWEARLTRDSLPRTTQADDYKRWTGGLGEWSGSFSFRLQFSDDGDTALSAWQLLTFIVSNTGDDLKGNLRLILQGQGEGAGSDVFRFPISDQIMLSGQVLISDVGLNCEDPERPIIATASWLGDGELTLERG